MKDPENQLVIRESKDLEIVRSREIEAFRPMTDQIKRLHEKYQWSRSMYQVINKMINSHIGIKSVGDPSNSVEQRTAVMAIRVRLESVLKRALDDNHDKDTIKAEYREVIEGAAAFFGLTKKKGKK